MAESFEELPLTGAEPGFPRHVALIMDGNGRWAKQRGLARLDGHRAGAVSVRKIVEECRRLGVRYVTLYSFSTENWRRAKDEVEGLMGLFRQYLDSELDTLLKNRVRLRAIGDLSRLPFAVRAGLNRTIEKTVGNDGMDLVLAVSYGSRDEILHAAREAAKAAVAGKLDPEDLDEEKFSSLLWTAGIPDPELVIRTSGEMRISNFLLWQVAYSELMIVPEYWPDFHEPALHRCLKEYLGRERRFGMTSEQVSGKK